jgi:hypothetical protein
MSEHWRDGNLVKVLAEAISEARRQEGEQREEALANGGLRKSG